MIKNRQLNEDADSLGPFNLAILFFAPLQLSVQLYDGGADSRELKENLRIITKDFVRKFSGPVYDSIIIACSYFDNHDLMVNSDEIRSQVLEVRKNNADYQDFTYAATGSKNRVIGRINMIYNIIANIIGKPADGDIKRIFTTDEKEELWNSSEKHICSYCGQSIHKWWRDRII